MLSNSGILLCALAHSIGWGIRGNWGHEYGAMIPGALSSIAACVLAQREDWRRRVAHFAFFGAMGWSFGGSMSYGRVQGYTHTVSPPDVYYGFAMLFIIGFLWGAMGGAGAAIPAVFDRRTLSEFYPPLIVVFVVWFLWEYVLRIPARDWYDTDWAGVLLLALAVLAYAAVRREMTDADSFILQMAAGWWFGFLVLVIGLGLRMTPPRGDNWAGCLGMTVAMWLYFRRNGYKQLLWISVASGIASGIGFSGGQLIRVFGFDSAIRINWHSVLEQSFGFVSGAGIAIGMWRLARTQPRVNEADNARPWTDAFAFCFVMLVISYINIVKNIHTVWLPQKQIPEEMLGIPALWWFRFAYLGFAAALISLVRQHGRTPLAVLPATWLGRGQALFLLFLWWIVLGNLSRYLPFQPARLVTEGVIHLSACVASVLILWVPRGEDQRPEPARLPQLRWWVAVSIVFVILCATLATKMVSKPFEGARYRFGPHSLEGR